jgi:hypothetical protein
MPLNLVTAKQIVWVFGNSGAGKETFIKDIVANHPSGLISLLGWRGKTIAAEPFSLFLIGKINFHDELTRQRYKILASVLDIINQADVILIKGKQVDLENKRPQKLKSMAPAASHSIIFLEVDIEENIERMKRKPWWSDKITHDDAVKMKDTQLRALEKLHGFPIQTLNSSSPFV